MAGGCAANVASRLSQSNVVRFPSTQTKRQLPEFFSAFLNPGLLQVSISSTSTATGVRNKHCPMWNGHSADINRRRAMDKIKNTFSEVIVIGFGVLGLAFFGAIVFYFFFGLIYLAVFGNGPATNSDECARGGALGWLSIFGGGLLGAILGYYGALKTRSLMRSRMRAQPGRSLLRGACFDGQNRPTTRSESHSFRNRQCAIRTFNRTVAVLPPFATGRFISRLRPALARRFNKARIRPILLIPQHSIHLSTGVNIDG